MSVNLEELTKPFPPEALKWRWADRNQTRKFTYVETHTVIRRLNDVTGNCWDFRVTKMDLHGDLWVASGELTIPGLGTRFGIGVQRVSERGGEDLVKGVASDCLKKCATLFGVGLELYGPDYEAGEVDGPPVQRQAAVQQRPQPQQQNQPQGNGAPLAGPYPISEAQMKYLHALAKDNQLDEAGLHAQVNARLGKASLRDLTKQDASKMIKWLQAKDLIDGVPVAMPRVDATEAKQGRIDDEWLPPEEPDYLRYDT